MIVYMLQSNTTQSEYISSKVNVCYFIRSEIIISCTQYKYTHMRKMYIKYAARNGTPFSNVITYKISYNNNNYYYITFCYIIFYVIPTYSFVLIYEIL